MSTKPTPPLPEVFPEWHDPFVKPQTIPAGWDLSAIRLDAGSALDEKKDGYDVEPLQAQLSHPRASV